MKNFCIIACSLLMAAALTMGIVSSSSVTVPKEETTLCDLDYVRVSF